MQGMWVWSLVGELRSHLLHGQNKKTWNRSNVVTNSIKTLTTVHIQNLKTTKQNIYGGARAGGKDMRQELGKPKKFFQWTVKSLVKVIQKQMWFDLITTRTPEKIVLQPSAMLVGQWKTVKPEKWFRLIPTTSCALPAAAEVSGIYSCSG